MIEDEKFDKPMKAQWHFHHKLTVSWNIMI